MPNGNGTNGKRQYGLRVSLEGFPSKAVRDLRFSKEGKPFLRFGFKVPAEGEGGEATWLNVVVFGYTAQVVAELMDGPLREGVVLRVEGELFSRKTKAGDTELNLIARNVAFIPLSKGTESSNGSRGKGDDEFPPEDELPF